MLVVGNDVIDLREAGVAGKSRDRRFVSRVFTEQEQALLASSERPDRDLWILWAAKEAAYKAIAKIHASAIFSWRKFQTTLSEFKNFSDERFYARIRTVYQADEIKVVVFGDADKIHAIGWGNPSETNSHARVYFKAERWNEKTHPQHSFTDRERKSIRGGNSEMVRYSLKQTLAKRVKINPCRLEIIRPPGNPRLKAPSLELDYKPFGIDISLSHHGCWVAWAYSWPAAEVERDQIVAIATGSSPVYPSTDANTNTLFKKML